MKKKNQKINEKKLTKASALSFQNIFKRETKLATYIIACMTIVVISLSYAMFFQVDNNSTNQEVIAGDLKFTYTDGVVINSTDNSKCFEPMNQDEAGLYASECSYQFSVQNTGSLKASYTLKLLANETNTSDPSKLKVILKKQNGDVLETVSGYPKTISTLTDGILLEATMESYDISVYSVQLYVDESVYADSDAGLTVSYKIEGTGLVHEDQAIHTADPYGDCQKQYGENAIQCNIIASLDTSGICPAESNLYLSAPSGEITNGIVCSAPDDYGSSYYFLGKAEDNWVKFGGHYWRIIRINGDNSVRIIYAGDASVIDTLDEETKSQVLSNGYDDSTTQYTVIGTGPFNRYWKHNNVTVEDNSMTTDNATFGYMYGNLEDGASYTTSKLQAQTNTNSSAIKVVVDEWYATNLSDYASYIADSLFCNDRTVISGNGYGSSYTDYRWNSKKGTLTCQEQNDRFTVDDEVNGNGDLTYPIGIISADEAYIVTGLTSSLSSYLNTGVSYWTMTPWYLTSSAWMMYVNATSGLSSYYSSGSYGIRPVINLKPGVLNSGDGSASNPYKIV